MRIDLNSTKDRYFDLGGTAKVVSIHGDWKGDRLVFKNASGSQIALHGTIESTHQEDAICFDGDVKNVSIVGFDGSFILGGGVTFWGRMENVSITSLHIFYPHTGIRATQPLPHQDVTIKSCYIIGASYEGIYIGPSYATTQPGKNVNIFDNRIVASGWDAIQVGNCKGAKIHENTISHAASRKTEFQDYAITINPNSTAFVWGNQIYGAEKRLQVLDSRCFDHPPK